jgi:hypothetical protein
VSNWSFRAKFSVFSIFYWWIISLYRYFLLFGPGISESGSEIEDFCHSGSGRGFGRPRRRNFVLKALPQSPFFDTEKASFFQNRPLFDDFTHFERALCPQN